MSLTPDTPRFTVGRADWKTDGDALRRIRFQVFVQEQAVPQALEWDGQDADALHVLALDHSGRPIGTGRLLPTGQIGRMAVLHGWRGHGVGKALLGELVAIAAGNNYPALFLNAQAAALPFYQREGFVPVGSEFEEAAIPHRRMIYRDHPDGRAD